MKRLFALTIGAAIISLSLLMAPLAFGAEAAKTEAPAAAAASTEKPCEPAPVKKAAKKHKKAKKAAKKAEKKMEEKPAEAAPAK